jgi:SAM-dependent methyltransferase
MDPSLYPRMAEVEDTHWWFASRRAICDHILDRISLAPDAAILEPGCGTGGNFAMLARRGKVFAMDSDESALSFAASRKIAILARGSLPAQIPFGDTRFDLAVLTDVVEHLDDPEGSLHAVQARLKAHGWLLVTVPALPWLWSEHDLTHHHRRRFRAPELRRMVTDAGFTVTYLSYYNFILFPAIAMVRLTGKILGRDTRAGNGHHDLAMPPAWVNRVLLRLFSSERHLVGTLYIPIGVSLIALART